MSAYWVSLKLAICTMLILMPLGILIARFLAHSQHALKIWLESFILLPLVLPPTVIGYYLLVTFSPQSVVGQWVAELFGQPLVFTFPGLVFASVIVNLPFAVQPVQLAFSNLHQSLREAAWVSGLSSWRTFWLIEMPLIRHGVLAGATLVFAHTLGEFGVVLMVGGNIEGSTRTVSIAIYDSVQGFDMRTAGLYSLSLLVFSIIALVVVRFYQTRHTQ